MKITITITIKYSIIIFYILFNILAYSGYAIFTTQLPGNRPVVKRYGKSWAVNCRIKASDTGFVNPSADGAYDEEEIEIETHVPLSIEMFEDANFQIPFEHTVDISHDSLEGQRVYVQVKANMEENSNGMIHVKRLGIHYKIGYTL